MNVLTYQESRSFVGVAKNVVGEEGRMRNVGSSIATPGSFGLRCSCLVSEVIANFSCRLCGPIRVWESSCSQLQLLLRLSPCLFGYPS